MLLADLVTAGRVKLDDSLQSHFPEDVRAPMVDDKPITLLHLATHTPGLPRLPDNLRPTDPTNPYADFDVEQLYAFLNGHTPARPPGRYAYSNLGMGLLGHVLALREGVSYEQLVRDRIAKPLDMKDTCITLNADQRKRLAPPYNAALAPDKNWELPTLAGAGAIRSTCRDLLLFLQANLAEDAALSESLQLAQRLHHERENEPTVGLGWHLGRDGATCEHNGMTGGYHAFLAVSPERKIGVAVLANTATMQITALGQRVTCVVLGEKVALPPRRKVLQVDRDVLESYAGFYAVTPQFGVNISAEDGKLFVQATGQPKFPLYAQSKTKFFLRAVEAQITFVADESGKVNKLVLSQNGQEIEAAR